MCLRVISPNLRASDDERVRRTALRSVDNCASATAETIIRGGLPLILIVGAPLPPLDPAANTRNRGAPSAGLRSAAVANVVTEIEQTANTTRIVRCIPNRLPRFAYKQTSSARQTTTAQTSGEPRLCKKILVHGSNFIICVASLGPMPASSCLK